MRLARRKDEIRNGVADLTIREAAAAVADAKPIAACPLPGPDWSEDELWEWAHRQVTGPFNSFDFEHFDLLRSKIHDQVGVPAIVSTAISLSTDDISALRLVPWNDLEQAAIAIAPLVKNVKERRMRMTKKHVADCST